MSDLQTRAADLIASGYKPVPVKEKRPAYAGDTSERDYAPEHFTDGMGIQIRAGLQKDGGYLYGYDLEGPSHGPTFDADREWEALEICTRLIAHPSKRLTNYARIWWRHWSSGTMKNLKKRLDALERAERSGPRFPDTTPVLMFSYATPAERAEWEAAGRPKIDPATWQQVLDQVYAD